MANSFHCTLITPQRCVLDEQVVYASVPAWDGLIGLMPNRAPLVAKMGDGPLRLDYASGGSYWFFLAGGFAQMKDNHLSLITSEAVAAQDIDEQQARAALKEAQAFIPRSEQDLARNQRDLTRARALMNLAHRGVGRS